MEARAVKSANKFLTTVILGLLVLAVGALPAAAEYIFETSMTGDQEAPPSGSTAYGQATLILNDAMTQASYTINFAGLDAARTSVGFYIGSPGTNGTLALALPNSVPQAGIWDITPEIADAIMFDTLYVNVFSDDALFPDGEIRGNFVLILVENEVTTLDAIKSLYR